MNKDLQNYFFNGLREMCDIAIDLMFDAHNLSLFEINKTKEKDIRVIELEEKQRNWLKEKASSFDEYVLYNINSPLFIEIENNLLSKTDEEHKKIYLYSLIIEFKKLSSIIYPQRSEYYKRIEKSITDSEQAIKSWEKDVNTEEAQRQIEAIRECIKMDKYKLSKTLEISKMCEGIINNIEDKPIEDKVFDRFCGMMHNFANRLDALCLKYKIDLLDLQNECGVYLKLRRHPADIEFFVGSRTLTEKLIKNLEESKSKNNSATEYKSLEGNIENGKETIPDRPDAPLCNNETSTKEEINDYFKFRYHKNTNAIKDYLNEIKKDILSQTPTRKLTKKMIGNVCLTLYKRNLHDTNRVRTFSGFVSVLCEYWDITPPKEKKENKYEILKVYSILERPLQ